MYSNFITPPDIVESVLVINATEDQIAACAKACESNKRVYNVYFWHDAMTNADWFNQVANLSSTILMDSKKTIDIPKDVSTPVVLFGSKKKLKNPADFFTK